MNIIKNTTYNVYSMFFKIRRIHIEVLLKEYVIVCDVLLNIEFI